MAIQAGTYRLGPDTGTLSVRTGRRGAASKAGHDLLIEVTSWDATLAVAEDPADTRIELSADGGSLRVREGTGGMQALGDDDKANIEQTIDEEVLRRQDISFRSSRVQPGGDGRLRTEGDLTLLGNARPIAFDVVVGADGAITASATVKQSTWGIKPYSALFGALKVADEVEVSLAAILPAAQSV
jgi:polyisoprenoid-binding protein YceI